jgi:co-chaperonin GroES (HSP10)
MKLSLVPFGHRVIVEPLTVEEDSAVPESLRASGFKVKSGFDIGDDERSLVAAEQGILVAVGPLAWKHPDFGYNVVPMDVWEAAWPKLGDKVVFGKYAGKLWPDPITKKKYFVLDDEAIQLKIEEE